MFMLCVRNKTDDFPILARSFTYSKEEKVPRIVLCGASQTSMKDATILSEEDSALLPSVTNEDDRFKGSPAVGVLVAFTKPPYGLYSGRREINLPVGKISSLVASLANTNPTNGEQFKLDFIEGALHYPMYYDYHIQNFTKQRLHETLEPGQELFEIEEGVDTELIFLVILVIALSIAILIGIWHWFTSIAQKRQPAKKSSKVVENDGENAVENEYLALIKNKPQIKKDRSDQIIRRHQGRR
ncbi:unnamed protein product [Schistosoma margrebowiei]|uniref:Uncharacterized protein n=1 Tax=Schistosoma margrebowiei TaxID=48269 RepID=A0A183N5B8_9TREM|nr:unnamed protein product [Schistosoma margrebowiei]